MLIGLAIALVVASLWQVWPSRRSKLRSHRALVRDTVARLDDRRLEIADVQRAPAGEVSLVEGAAAQLAGRVVAPRDGGLRAPVAGDACVAYRIAIHSARCDRWGAIELCDVTRGADFEVDDGNQLVAVDAAALVLVTADASTHWHDSATPAIEELVDDRFRGLPMVVQESVLRAGDRVVVRGIVTFTTSVGLYRGGAPRPMLVASDRAPVTVWKT